jgi:hypothetical protein
MDGWMKSRMWDVQSVQSTNSVSVRRIQRVTLGAILGGEGRGVPILWWAFDFGVHSSSQFCASVNPSTPGRFQIKRFDALWRAES